MALLPPFYLDAVLSLEMGQDEQFSTVATGVIVGFDYGESDADGKQLVRTMLVTNRHVLDKKVEIWARFGQGNEGDRHQLLLMDGETPRWKSHPHFDVAAIPIDTAALRESTAQQSFVVEGQHTFTLAEMEDSGVSVGDGVFVLGFPMGLSGAEKKRTIVRTGGIARLDAEVIKEVGGFLIDATVFPGNSGGPVFNIPSQAAIDGTKAVSNCNLIGIVDSYLPYEDVAVSRQTGRERIVFQENSGLASVVPFDAIKEVASSALAVPPPPGTGDQAVRQGDAEGERVEPPLDAGVQP